MFDKLIQQNIRIIHDFISPGKSTLSPGESTLRPDESTLRSSETSSGETTAIPIDHNKKGENKIDNTKL